jgi:predicted  nucleic acid-binding Zn-ribbon protein
VNEEMGLLIQLQRVDARLSKFKENEQVHQKKIESERSLLAEIKVKLEETRRQLEQLSKERREKESEIEDQEQQIQKTQSHLKEIKNNKEYQAHLHEIDTLKRGRGTIEEAVLLLMDRIEILKNEMATEEQSCKEKELKFSETVQTIEKEIAGLHEEKLKLTEERKKLSDQINKKIMVQYEHLLTTRKGTALAGVSGNTCLGCHMSLPPQLVAEVKRNEKLLTCSQCYRILYWQEIYSTKTA